MFYYICSEIMEKQKKYSVWLADSNGRPIDGTDRTMIGPSKKYILKYLAVEENISYKGWESFIIRPNGDRWCVCFLCYTN